MLDKFTYVKKGYDPYEVDEYVEKLEEMLKTYKQKDNTINNAIVSAQMAADNIINEANVKAAQMLSDTEIKIEQLKNILAMQKSIIDTFYTDYNALVNKYLSNLDGNDMITMYAKINSIEERINSLRSDRPSDTSSASSNQTNDKTQVPKNDNESDEPIA